MRRGQRDDSRHRSGFARSICRGSSPPPAPFSGTARWACSSSTSSAKARARSRNAIARSKAFSLAGGGDTLAAIEKYGVEDSISYISTGGGAFLEFVEGKKLPRRGRPGAARQALMDFILRRATKIVATLGPGDRRPQGARRYRAGRGRRGADQLLARPARRSQAPSRLGARGGTRRRGATSACSAICRTENPHRALRGGQGTARRRRRVRLDASLAVDAGNEHAVGIAYKKLPTDVIGRRYAALERRPNQSSRCRRSTDRGSGLACCVGGELGNSKGINRQGGGLSARRAHRQGPRGHRHRGRARKSIIWRSRFARDGADMSEARNLLRSAGGRGALVAKIERARGGRRTWPTWSGRATR